MGGVSAPSESLALRDLPLIYTLTFTLTSLPCHVQLKLVAFSLSDLLRGCSSWTATPQVLDPSQIIILLAPSSRQFFPGRWFSGVGSWPSWQGGPGEYVLGWTRGEALVFPTGSSWQVDLGWYLGTWPSWQSVLCRVGLGCRSWPSF